MRAACRPPLPRQKEGLHVLPCLPPPACDWPIHSFQVSYSVAICVRHIDVRPPVRLQQGGRGAIVEQNVGEPECCAAEWCCCKARTPRPAAPRIVCSHQSPKHPRLAPWPVQLTSRVKPLQGVALVLGLPAPPPLLPPLPSAPNTLHIFPTVATHQQGETLALVLGQSRRAVGAPHRRVLQGGRAQGSRVQPALRQGGPLLCVMPAAEPDRIEQAAGHPSQQPFSSAWSCWPRQPPAACCSFGPSAIDSQTPSSAWMPHHVLPEGQPAAGEPVELVTQAAPIPVGRRRAQVKTLRSLLRKGKQEGRCLGERQPKSAGAFCDWRSQVKQEGRFVGEQVAVSCRATAYGALMVQVGTFMMPCRRRRTSAWQPVHAMHCSRNAAASTPGPPSNSPAAPGTR